MDGGDLQPLMRTHRFVQGRSWLPPPSPPLSPEDRAIAAELRSDVQRTRASFVQHRVVAAAETLRLARLAAAEDGHFQRREAGRECARFTVARRKLPPDVAIEYDQRCQVRPIVIEFDTALPEGTVYSSINRNFFKPDDTKLRFVPFFGDDDEEHFNCEAYDVGGDDSELELTDEIRFVACQIARQHGTGSGVLAALTCEFGVAHSQLRDLLGLACTTVAANDAVDGGHSLETFEAIFCRRCCLFNCGLHGTYQPRSRKRRLPRGCDDADPVVTYRSDTSSPMPCSPSCFKHGDVGFPTAPPFTPAEKALFRQATVVFGDDWCGVAILMDKACGDVVSHATRVPLEYGRPGDRERPVPPTRLTLAQLQGRSGSKLHQFVACDHGGSCATAPDCSCHNNGHFCDKFCACDRSCRRRFNGCRCRGTKDRCQTQRCPCFAAGRECDIDVCGICEMGTACGNCGLGTYRQRAPLLLGRSAVHGWGAFAARDIAKGNLITEYTGEMISQEEADRRGQTYDKRDCSYLFDVNVEFVVDACFKGNKIKFANHSESPNCSARIVYVQGDYRIGIFAKRDIARGEELKFNYHHKKAGGTPKWLKKNYSNFK